MKIISYNAISINGIIAREDYTEDFLSDLDWKIFCHLSKKYKCLIISKKSYDLIKKLEDLNFLNIKNIDKIILTKNRNIKSIKPNYYVNSPKEAIKRAKILGHKEALLSGGGILNTLFIKEKLINEIILNIDPVMVSKGINLFQQDKFEVKLKLLKNNRQFNIIDCLIRRFDT